MLIVLNLHLTAVLILRMGMVVRMAFVSILHPLNQLLLQNIHIIHHRKDLHTGGIGGFQHLGKPVLHGPPIADQKVSLLNGNHIRGSRLKGMAVHSSRYHQSQFHPVSGHLAHKIIIRENSGDHIQTSVRLHLFPGRAAAGQSPKKKQEGRKQYRPPDGLSESRLTFHLLQSHSRPSQSEPHPRDGLRYRPAKKPLIPPGRGIPRSLQRSLPRR